MNYCMTIEILKVEAVWRNIDQIEYFFLLPFLKKSGNFLITLSNGGCLNVVIIKTLKS